MTVIEAAQEAVVRSDGIEEKGVMIKDAGSRDAPEITLRLALEQHVTQALDPRQRVVSAETAPGYDAMPRLQVPRRLDMPITDIARQMVKEKIKAMSNKPTTASGLRMRPVRIIRGELRGEEIRALSFSTSRRAESMSAPERRSTARLPVWQVKVPRSSSYPARSTRCWALPPASFWSTGGGLFNRSTPTQPARPKCLPPCS